MKMNCIRQHDFCTLNYERFPDLFTITKTHIDILKKIKLNHMAQNSTPEYFPWENNVCVANLDDNKS